MVFADKKSSRCQTDGPTNVQPSDAKSSSEAGSEAAEYLRQRLALLSVEDPAGYVPSLVHEKADMLIAYGTVKGMITWKTDGGSEECLSIETYNFHNYVLRYICSDILITFAHKTLLLNKF